MTKLLVRLPETKEELLLSMPFLFKLEEEFEGAEINLILNEDLSEFIVFFPESVSTYSFKAENNNVPGIHKFSVNLNVIYNIDYYFDLISNFKSGFMGFSFKAKNRIGYKNVYNEIFLTEKLVITDPCLRYSDQWSIGMLERVQQKSFESYLFKISSGEKKEIKVEKLFNKDEVTEFLLVTFEPNEDENFEIWENILKELSGKSIILWNTREDDTFIEHLEILSEELLKTNDVYLMRKGSIKELYLYLMKARGVITSSPWLSLLATLCGRSSLYLKKQEQEINYFWEHIQNKADRIEVSGDGTFRIISAEDIKAHLKEKDVTEYIQDFFCLEEPSQKEITLVDILDK